MGLVVHRPTIESNGNIAKLKVTIEENGVEREMWYSTSSEFSEYLCHERSDAFAIPILLYAMKRNLPVKLVAPISERLYYTWSNYLAKAISHIFPEYRVIPLDCSVSNVPLQNAGAVGTGLSCGIDSFSTIADHLSEYQPKRYQLTHCTFFNVGNHSPLWIDPQKTQELFKKRVDLVNRCAEEIGLTLVVLDSNVDEFIDRPFAALHTFRNISAVLALQKLFQTYYYSSGHSVYDFNLSKQDSGDYDIFSLSMLSTGTLDFFSSGTLYTRIEKTKIVSSFPLSYNNLNVCLYEESNCSLCEKCLRTLLTLDILGNLDNYKNIFDLGTYEKNKEWFIGYVLTYRNGNSHYQEIYEAMKQNNYMNKSMMFYFTKWYKHRIRNIIERRMERKISAF